MGGFFFYFEPIRITRSPRCEHSERERERERAIFTGRGDGVGLTRQRHDGICATQVSLCRRGGRCIEKILGAGSTPLEQFLIKRKLMGPCWVRIDAPVQRDSKVSWCVLEVEVSDSKKITVARDCPYSAPPLVCTTLSVKTAVNPKSHQHEIVAVAALTHRGAISASLHAIFMNRLQERRRWVVSFLILRPFAGVAVDGATPDGGRGEDARLFQHSTEKQEAGSRRWTCVAARPLGSEIAGAQDTPLDPKLPRDLHGELKKATHGFLADRGTVTVAPNERALISVLLARLQRDDPDVLCGHNILGFDSVSSFAARRWRLVVFGSISSQFIRVGAVAACQRDRGRVDGVFTRQRRRDAVIAAAREPTRRVRELRWRLPETAVIVTHAGFELDVLLARALALKVGNAWSKVGRLKRNKPPHRWKAASASQRLH